MRNRHCIFGRGTNWDFFSQGKSETNASEIIEFSENNRKDEFKSPLMNPYKNKGKMAMATK